MVLWGVCTLRVTGHYLFVITVISPVEAHSFTVVIAIGFLFPCCVASASDCQNLSSVRTLTFFLNKGLSFSELYSVNTPQLGNRLTCLTSNKLSSSWFFFPPLFGFAGSCILQFWNYSSASEPCKCPMCTCKIVNLMPDASLQQQQDQEVTEVLKSIQRYNLLFVGGVRGFVQVYVLI